MLLRFSAVLALLVSLGVSEIRPAYQLLTWQHNETNYFTPLSLNTTVYKFASPSGILPESLNRRSYSTPKSLYVPCSVVTLNSSTGSLTGSTIENILAEYESIDDVWTASQFLECLFVQYDGNETGVDVDKSFMDFISSTGVEYTFLSSAFKQNVTNGSSTTQIHPILIPSSLTNGPYVAGISSFSEGVSLTSVYTLHTDDYEAFMEGSIPDPLNLGSHLSLHVSLPGTRLPSILVPSRLSSTASNAGPLSGLRFAVKDIFHIKGHKTSGGSRSYYETYGPQNYSTETVELCLDGGAQLIGKTRTIAFALGAPVDGQEVDFLNPWSARGDGYQNTGGSSSGSGAAVTGYDWVDFALGSDTGGSVRFPARYGGLYGYKPTHGIFNITGILVAISEQDTPGFMTRSPKIFTTLGHHWAKDKPLTPVPFILPKNLLLYADEDPLTQPTAESLKQSFFANVTRALNLTTSSINVISTFINQNVSGTSPPQDQSTFMTHVYADQNSVEGWDEIGAPLTALYKQLFDGASPPAGDPPVNISWTDGQNETTRARFPESQRRRVVFGEWWNRVVTPGNNETCSQSIFAHSYHTPPTLQKVTPTESSLTVGWYNGVAINYAGTPEIVVPIGQVEYFSPFTLKIEQQPVTVAFSVAKGCDLVLFELVDQLVEKGLLVETLAGKVAFPI